LTFDSKGRIEGNTRWGTDSFGCGYFLKKKIIRNVLTDLTLFHKYQMGVCSSLALSLSANFISQTHFFPIICSTCRSEEVLPGELSRFRGEESGLMAVCEFRILLAHGLQNSFP
jgi:hypothetical protein